MMRVSVLSFLKLEICVVNIFIKVINRDSVRQERIL